MPSLIILAGPNGAGKTRYSEFLENNRVLTAKPINLDLLAEQALNDIPHSIYGIEQRLAKNVDKLFYDYCTDAIERNYDFCYECNFRRDQLKYVGLFEEAGYKLILIFFLLESVEQSRERVKFRFENQEGKNVDINSISENFNQGYFNLDNGFENFNKVIIIDNSEDNYFPNNDNPLKIQLLIENGEFHLFNNNFPSEKLKLYLPKIAMKINSIKKNL